MTFEFEELSPNEFKELFKQWRENNDRQSEDVVKVWMMNPACRNKLGSDFHIILEQVITAALDTHNYALANNYIVELSQEFPESLRVMKHHASLLEAEEKYEEALACLDFIINADETNSAARKRRVAILKAQGLIPEAIKELVEYLKKFMADGAAWQELAALYARAGELRGAAAAAAELLLHQPHHHLHHQRLADIYYTMGSVDNLELAKTYYCQAIKLNPENMRAQLGLFLSCTRLLGACRAASGARRRELASLRAAAAAAAGRALAPALLALSAE